MPQKIGFWSVFAIVTGSQIGTTVFMSPASLAQYGIFSLIGWLLSGCGAISLCLVFASLCSRFPRTVPSLPQRLQRYYKLFHLNDPALA